MTILTKDQKKKLNVVVTDSKLYPELNGKILKITIRYDDECGNGHNSFAITGSCGGNNGIGGRIHSFIAEQAPELKKYIKWHLMSSNGPMHYIANSLYHAKEVKRNTVPRFYDNYLKFEDIPFTFKLSKKLKEFLESYNGEKLEVVAVKHPKDPETYSDNFTFSNCELDWYKCLFHSKREAEEMLEALNSRPFEIIKEVSSYENEKTPDLKAARSSAIWPDAELEDFTKEKLEARLPQLIEDFKRDLDELGLVY